MDLLLSLVNTPRLQPADYGDITKVLKKVMLYRFYKISKKFILLYFTFFILNKQNIL